MQQLGSILDQLHVSIPQAAKGLLQLPVAISHSLSFHLAQHQQSNSKVARIPSRSNTLLRYQSCYAKYGGIMPTAIAQVSKEATAYDNTRMAIARWAKDVDTR